MNSIRNSSSPLPALYIQFTTSPLHLTNHLAPSSPKPSIHPPQPKHNTADDRAIQTARRTDRPPYRPIPPRYHPILYHHRTKRLDWHRRLHHLYISPPLEADSDEEEKEDGRHAGGRALIEPQKIVKMGRISARTHARTVRRFHIHGKRDHTIVHRHERHSFPWAPKSNSFPAFMHVRMARLSDVMSFLFLYYPFVCSCVYRLRASWWKNSASESAIERAGGFNTFMTWMGGQACMFIGT